MLDEQAKGGPDAPAHQIEDGQEGLSPELLDLLQRVPAILYIAEAGGEGAWRYVSPQIEDILGFTPEEWRAEPRCWAQQLHPQDRDRILRYEAAALAGNPFPGTSEYRMLHRDGRTVWVRDEAALMDTPQGRVWHGVMSVITDRKQVEAELEQRAAQQSAVARLGEHALEGATPADLMHEAVTAVAQILDVELAAVFEVQEPGWLLLHATKGWPEWMTGSVHRDPGTRSAIGSAILSGQPVVISEWERETHFTRSPALVEINARSGVSVPIEGRDGRFGALTLQSRQPRHFKAGDVAFVQALANVLADALQRQATEDDIRHRALHDPLTGLPNRVLFLDRIEQALARVRRRGSLAAVLFLDLDHFKLINDTMGHHLGDELLAAAAPRIQQTVRASDTVARFGGDEFAVLLDEIKNEREAIETAERIGQMFTVPFVLAGNEHFVTASIGIAFAQGHETASELIRDADAAMYRSKDQGRARYELFDEVMRARAVSRLRVENDLRRALDRGELLLHYQPIVSLPEREIVGAEALLRWSHPEGGLIPTREFIEVAEENGMIEPIGRWVLEHACAQAARWNRGRTDGSPVSVSVNLSPVQVVKPTFPELIAGVLEQTGLDPSLLYLEITETVMLREDQALMEVLTALKKLGARLMLDDFGTGYSSLAYLTHLPLDGLKVDRSFVDGLGTEGRDTAVAEAIIAMSKALGLQVVGEGVETGVQAAQLERIGCEMAQGFWFSRPVSAEEITGMISGLPAPATRARPVVSPKG